MKKYCIHYHKRVGRNRRREVLDDQIVLKVLVDGWSREDAIRQWKSKMGNFGKGWVIDKVEWIH